MTWIAVPNAAGTDVKYQYRINYGQIAVPAVLREKTEAAMMTIKK